MLEFYIGGVIALALIAGGAFLIRRRKRGGSGDGARGPDRREQD